MAMLAFGEDMKQPRDEKKKNPPVVIALNVEAKKSPDGEVVLDLQLTNKSKKPLVVYESSLPWSGEYGMTLIVLETNLAEGRQLKRGIVRIDDPTTKTRTIAPDETISGEIKLSKRFPELAASVKKSDVEVFWSCKIKTIDKIDVRRVGGWALIEKGEEEK